MSNDITLLVRMPNWLGDCVMALPAVRHLTENLPKARLYLAGRKNFHKLLAAQPGVAGYVEAPDKGLGELVRGMTKTRQIVREAGIDHDIDIGLLLTNSLSTAAWMWRTGARERLGLDRDCRRIFLTSPHTCGDEQLSWHLIQLYHWLAQLTEASVCGSVDNQVSPPEAVPVPTIQVGDAARAEAAALLRSVGVQGPYAVIAPASAYGAVKDWPAESYHILVGKIVQEFGYPVVVTGAAAQADTAASIARDLPGVVDLAGRTGLDGFVGLLAGASLFIGGDSGGAHVAAAFGLPTVVIFGITNPRRTRPTGRRVVCIGNGQDRDVKLSTPEAREAARRVLQAISPDAVLEAARKAIVLGGVPGNA